MASSKINDLLLESIVETLERFDQRIDQANDKNNAASNDLDILLENQARIYSRICKISDDVEYLISEESRTIRNKVLTDLERKQSY